MEQPEDNQQISCPTTCPNRDRNGITLNFGKRSIHLDPFEFILWSLLLLPCGGIVKEAWLNTLTFDETARRIGIIAGLGALIRTSPTEQIYELLSKFKVGGDK